MASELHQGFRQLTDQQVVALMIISIQTYCPQNLYRITQ
ncbi:MULTISPECIES: DUF732 domain-containing protein [Mycolicibacterium]|nr:MULTISPECIES: DUF732 domain-containing protein [Mycolicibacterium]UCZ59715.1 DUF732 domain-containing protein [Mycolicibacterium phocaicum]